MFHKKIYFAPDAGGAVGGAATSAPASSPAPASQPVSTPAQSSAPASTEGNTTSASTSDSPVIIPQQSVTTNTTQTNASDTKKNDIVAGGLKLTIDPKTGKKIVVTIPNEPPKAEPKVDVKPEEQLGTPNPNALPKEPTKVPEVDDKQKGLVEPQIDAQTKSNDYSPEELLVAMQLNQVDESRIPSAIKAQYEEYKANQAKAAEAVKPPEQVAKEQQEQSIQFYSKVNTIAEQMAMKEIGITQEDIVAAQYSDDQALIDKVNNYKSAVEFNKSRIFTEIQAENTKKAAIAQQQKAEHDAIYNDVADFTHKMQQEEPHFNEIDKMMVNRYKELPYDKAKDIEPAIVALQKGTLTRQQAITLQEYYNDTRKEFYAKVSGVGTVPAPVITPKPPVVETPGNLGQINTSPDYSKLRKMNITDKVKFISNILHKQK